MLLLEEFIEKKVAQVGSLLEYVENQFREHPDFSDRKQVLFDEFARYRDVLNELKFEHLPTRWIDELLE